MISKALRPENSAGLPAPCATRQTALIYCLHLPTLELEAGSRPPAATPPPSAGVDTEVPPGSVSKAVEF